MITNLCEHKSKVEVNQKVKMLKKIDFCYDAET